MVISIEISDDKVKIIHASKKGEILSILDCITINIKSGIKDGKINDIKYLSSLISQALNNKKIRTKKAVFVINSESIITRKIKLPLLNKKQDTMSMLKYELGYILPVDLNQYEFIYKIVEPHEYNNAFFVIYCMPLDLLNQYYELAKNLKFKSVVFDVSSNCLNKISSHNLCINRASVYEDVIAFVEISSNKIFFCVLNKGVNDFSLTTAISQDCNNQMVAESIAQYATNNQQDHDIFVYKVIDEINKYIRYYHSINTDININKIHIYGSYSYLENITQMLSQILNIESSVLKNISNIQFLNLKTEDDFNMNIHFAPLLAAFNDKRDIYFKPKSDSILLNIQINSVIIVAVAFVLFFVLNGFVIFKLKEIDSMKQYVTNMDNIVSNNQIENLKKDITYLENILNNVDKLKAIAAKDDFVCSVILREIKYAIPKDTLVTSISVDSNSTVLNCTSDSMEEVTLFLYNLRKIEFIDSVYMPGVEVVKDYDGNYSYSVVCVIKEVADIGE